MTTPATTQDAEQLRILSILYYVWGGLGLVFSCVGGGYVMFMFSMLTATTRNGNGPPPQLKGILALVGIMMLLFGLVMAGLSVWAGKCLADRRHLTYCMIVAGVSCLSFPLGTALGVFTFIVLSRPTVKALFVPQR